MIYMFFVGNYIIDSN
jgi:Ca2+-dependent lipid-binding protein